MDDEELQRRFTEEFTQLVDDQRTLTLQMTPLEAWALLSNLQLALRHPANTGGTFEIARSPLRDYRDGWWQRKARSQRSRGEGGTRSTTSEIAGSKNNRSR